MKSAFAASLLVIVSATAAPAATLTASVAPGGGDLFFTGFTIQFTDTNGNSLFELGELTSFSGVSFEGPVYSRLLNSPDIAGFSALEILPGATPTLPESRWAFDFGGDLGAFPGLEAPTSYWTYALELDATPVPLPATMPLMLAGLCVGVALLRRRRN